MMAAAAEAARSSSGGGADTYIGSLISLTSKSEIRYEGVLYNINAQESTIGLRNVRSFGTEGRKKDGPQVPPSDKIYEFILFRGTDIKDLQVKSSPPVQTTTTTAINNDPAIIQSHLPQAATAASMSLPPSSTGSLPAPNSQTSSLGPPTPVFQGNLPLYKPGGSLGTWSSSPSGPSSTTSGSGLAMPMYWQGYYAPASGLQAQQQALLRPPPGLSVSPSMQQSSQYPVMNTSNFSASQLSENPSSLLPPISKGTMNLQPSIPPAQSSIAIQDSANLIPDKSYFQGLPTTSLSNNLSVTSSAATALDKSAIALSGYDLTKTVPGPLFPSKNMSEPLASIARTSRSVLNEGATPSLVTPGQFLPPDPSVVPSLQSSQTSQKNVEVVKVLPESPVLPSTAVATEVQEPILPLSSSPEHKLHGAPKLNYHGSRGGRERGRGNGILQSPTTFTEEFDFTAMNEKFNKDEVWGYLGKSNQSQEYDDLQYEDNVGSSKVETKPVYVKDDFFDSLSCDSLDGGSRNGRTRFSEQYRRDTETFGSFSQHRGGRGGWGGPARGGRTRGGYYGRGYGYARGRGYGASNRAI